MTHAQLGVFLRTSVRRKQREKDSLIFDMWAASHANEHKDILKYVNAITLKKKKKEPTQAEIDNSWRKLASFAKSIKR